MKYYHHDHHGCAQEALSPEALSDLDKARMLLDHMLDHNRHHEEEMAALAERFAAAGQTQAAKKIRTARARMVEANLALMEALEIAKAAAPAEE